MTLDEKILENLTTKNLKRIYDEYADKKRDYLCIPNKDKRIMGEDGISIRVYDKIFYYENNFTPIMKRIKSRKYLFKPFREIEISKDKALTVSEAKKKDKIRILSIANVKDTVVQQLIYDSIKNYTEEKFQKVDQISFAYREGKSAPSAVRKIEKYIEKGYMYILNIDLSKFFDTIDHKILIDDLYSFFCKENKILLSILKNFIYSYRITPENLNKARYKGKKMIPKYKLFHNVKVKREKREKGIPQGGILSGLLANIYLYDFDLWMIKTLNEKYDLKYIRYADDFLVLLKNSKNIETIFNEIKEKLLSKNLIVHPLGEKSQIINLNKKMVNYVGFEIQKNKTRVKKENIEAFKTKIKKIFSEIKKSKEYKEKKVADVQNRLITKINFKILGNRAYYEICEKCGKMVDYRSWIGYFGNITDVNQLKVLDNWIYNYLKYFMYKNFKIRIKKREIYFKKNVNYEENNYKLRSLEWEYYYYRRSLQRKVEFCKCTPKEKYDYEQY